MNRLACLMIQMPSDAYSTLMKLNTSPNQRKLFFKKSARDAYLKTPTCGKAMYTVLAAGNAAGEYLESLVVYEAVHLNENWTANGPDGTRYAVSYNG